MSLLSRKSNREGQKNVHEAEQLERRVRVEDAKDLRLLHHERTILEHYKRNLQRLNKEIKSYRGKNNQQAKEKIALAIQILHKEITQAIEQDKQIEQHTQMAIRAVKALEALANISHLSKDIQTHIIEDKEEEIQHRVTVTQAGFAKLNELTNGLKGIANTIFNENLQEKKQELLAYTQQLKAQVQFIENEMELLELVMKEVRRKIKEINLEKEFKDMWHKNLQQLQ